MKMYRYSVVYYDKYNDKFEEEHGLTFGGNEIDVIRNLNIDYGEDLEAVKLENCYIEGERTASFDELKKAMKDFVPLNADDYE